jgi:hypothetical protein
MGVDDLGTSTTLEANKSLGVFRVQAGSVLQCTVDQNHELPGQPVESGEGLGKLPGLCCGKLL